MTHLAAYYQSPLVPTPLQEEDDPAFPLRVAEIGTTPVPMGVSFIKDLPGFTSWMTTDLPRATLETPASGNIIGGRDFHTLAHPHVGYLREYFNHQGYQDCFEYWAPVGLFDSILGLKLKRDITVDRESLVHWLLNVFRMEDGLSSTQFAFQVLEVPHGDLSCWFWRTNQPKGKFVHCDDPEWRKQQDERRRQQSANRAKDYQGRQQQSDAWSSYRERSGRNSGYGWGSGGAQAPPWSKDNARSQGGRWS